MAYVIADRAFVNCSTAGTGTYTLGTTISGHKAFGDVLANADTTTYVAFGGTDFELGVGTYTSSGTTLSRDTIIRSSNTDNAVNWSGDYFIMGSFSKRDLQTAVSITGGTISGITSLSVSGNTDLNDNDLIEANLKDYSIEEYPQTTSGTVTCDFNNGNVHTVTMNGNVTGWTISNWPPSGTLGKMTIFIKQDGTGSRTCAFPAGWKWFDGDTAMTVTSTANAVDCIVIMSPDAGTTIYAIIVGQNA